MSSKIFRWILYIIIFIALIVVWSYSEKLLNQNDIPEEFAYGNGRIEATQYDIATKLPGRIIEVLVQEGDLVQKGQILAKLDTSELQARLKQAQAQVEQAKQSKKYSKAVVVQHESELALAEKNHERAKNLYVNNNISLMQLQQSQTVLETTKASLLAAKAQAIGSDSVINALIAQKQTIQANLDETILYAPIDGRVLYKLIESGEVVGAGGKVLTLIDLNDISMSIFLPTSKVGQIKIGSQARIKLDSLPNKIITATVSFVSPDAQFTPKEIETQNEREKLMFKVKVHVDTDFLEKNPHTLNSGLSGVAYIRLDETIAWPENLEISADNNLQKSLK